MAGMCSYEWTLRIGHQTQEISQECKGQSGIIGMPVSILLISSITTLQSCALIKFQLFNITWFQLGT
jgi:hypothetical protein